MAVLGGRFTMMLIVDAPEGTDLDLVREELERTRARLGLDALSLHPLAEPSGRRRRAVAHRHRLRRRPPGHRPRRLRRARAARGQRHRSRDAARRRRRSTRWCSRSRCPPTSTPTRSRAMLARSAPSRASRSPSGRSSPTSCSGQWSVRSSSTRTRRSSRWRGRSTGRGRARSRGWRRTWSTRWTRSGLRRAGRDAARRDGADGRRRRQRPQEGDDHQRPARARQPARSSRAEGAEVGREGCLSIPELTANVRRATAIAVDVGRRRRSTPRASRRAACSTRSTTSTACCSSTAWTPSLRTCSAKGGGKNAPMHAMVIDEWGGPETLHEADVEPPPVGPGLRAHPQPRRRGQPGRHEDPRGQAGGRVPVRLPADPRLGRRRHGRAGRPRGHDVPARRRGVRLLPPPSPPVRDLRASTPSVPDALRRPQARVALAGRRRPRCRSPA